MEVKKHKISLIEKAIDAIIDVGEDIEESDPHYFIHSENSVISKLRSLQTKVEDGKES